MKLFLDTSVVLRFYVKEDEKTHRDVVQLFQHIKIGKLRPYCSGVVIQEIIYVLTSVYKFPKDRVLDATSDFIAMRNMTVIEKADSQTALKLYRAHNVKYGDCLIASQLPEGVTLCSYDHDFPTKLKIPIITPSDVIASKKFDFPQANSL